MRFLLCLLLLTVPELSNASTIDFSELGFGSPIGVNGLHLQGVQFGFTPGLAVYNGVAGTTGTTEWSIDPILMGPTTGTLTLGFDVPTSILRFDIVLRSIFPLDDVDMGGNGGPAFTVVLAPGVSQSGSTAPQPNGVYSEGRFQYTGAPITSATITFFNGMDMGNMQVAVFGLDNLTFGVPEPATLWLIAAGLIGAGAFKRYPRRQR